jgi:hypothetical protein
LPASDVLNCSGKIFDAVDIGQVTVEHDLVTADEVDFPLDHLGGNGQITVL